MITIHKTGKKPAIYSSKDIRLSESAGSAGLPTVPSIFTGYANDFQNGYPGWSELGNGPCDDGSITDTSWVAYQGAGDCFWAGNAETFRSYNKNNNQPIPSFTCLNVLQDNYAPYVASQNNGQGYNLQTGANDTGTDCRAGYSYIQNQGLIDVNGNKHTVLIYVSLELGNFTELLQALYLFDSVGIGIECPENAMDQFNAGQPWSVVNGAQIEGGHFIPILSRPNANYWTVITWAKAQLVSNQFITTYMDEAWAVLTPETYSKVTGETVSNYTEADLEKFITLFPKVTTTSTSV